MMLENIFEILTPLGHDFFFNFLIFYWYNKTICQLFFLENTSDQNNQVLHNPVQAQ